jgi:hypothetical protein
MIKELIEKKEQFENAIKIIKSGVLPENSALESLLFVYEMRVRDLKARIAELQVLKLVLSVN